LLGKSDGSGYAIFSSKQQFPQTIETTMRPLLTFALCLAVTLFTACSPVRVSQDYVQTADFSAIHTYGWRSATPPPSDDPRINNPLLRQRFRDAIEQTLNQRGYQQAAEPDVLIDYSHAILSRLDSDQLDVGFGFGFARDPAFGGFFGGVPSIRQYDTSVLTINIYDSSGEKLLWRGTGSEILTTYDSPSELTTAVNRMVTTILAQFPPTAAP
jgi:hypothetical protein